MILKTHTPPNTLVERLSHSARDKTPVAGLTHNFYRYPARFSPVFASTAIELFSRPGDLILDPYMGGGTTIIEAIVAGRRAVGADLNSLAVFIARVKTTRLKRTEQQEVLAWISDHLETFSYVHERKGLEEVLNDKRTKNMTLVRARFIKKIIAASIISLESIESSRAKDFARCAILKTGQWALDGRKTHTQLSEFRSKLVNNIHQMLTEIRAFGKRIIKRSPGFPRCKLIETNASLINKAPIFAKRGLKVDLVVTSPPYPGLHILYHRWQVDGRRETPAPYWIAGCQDGQGDSYYNFGSRQQTDLHSYFESSLVTLKSIRSVMQPRGYMVQMLAFKNPTIQLLRYLENMEEAGFREVSYCDSDLTSVDGRIWRTVPNRKWHSIQKGETPGSREVVLIHEVV